jgi:hypothetical protein
MTPVSDMTPVPLVEIILSPHFYNCRMVLLFANAKVVFFISLFSGNVFSPSIKGPLERSICASVTFGTNMYHWKNQK